MQRCFPKRKKLIKFKHNVPLMLSIEFFMFRKKLQKQSQKEEKLCILFKRNPKKTIKIKEPRCFIAVVLKTFLVGHIILTQEAVFENKITFFMFFHEP